MQFQTRLAVLFAGLFAAQASFAQILPENNLHLFDDIFAKDAKMTEAEFNQLTDAVIKEWEDLAKIHGATLVANKNWTDSTVNAYATQSGKTWQVSMFGGLARRAEVTNDGFQLVVCHELGHHFAGFPFYGANDWAASEGESDYFATQVCARKIWSDEPELNATYKTRISAAAVEKCDAAWSVQAERDLCYRASAGGQSLANLLAALGGQGTPKFETPDPTVVSKTNVNHPKGQCRLDTYFQGALCPTVFDVKKIPGRKHPMGQGSKDAEQEAITASCAKSAGFELGNRPLCWFKPQL